MVGIILQERKFLDEHKKARELENVFPLTTETGEVIMDEMEFSALTHLKEVYPWYPMHNTFCKNTSIPGQFLYYNCLT